MNKQRVVAVIDRVSMGLSLTGLLGLAGLAGFIKPELFRCSYLSYFSFLAYFRFFKAFLIPKLSIPAERVPILCFSIVVPCLVPSLANIPALGFLGFLGFFALLVEKKDQREVVGQNG